MQARKQRGGVQHRDKIPESTIKESGEAKRKSDGDTRNKRKNDKTKRKGKTENGKRERKNGEGKRKTVRVSGRHYANNLGLNGGDVS